MISKQTITVITPTADQPTGLALLERYMARQTLQPHQWVVADDGDEPATLHAGQEHVVRDRTSEGGASLAENMMAALQRAEGEIIVVMEHDDWYSPNHLETLVPHIRDSRMATGSLKQRYFNVRVRQYRVMDNVGSALCNTVFHRRLIPNMLTACRKAIAWNRICVDRFFWDSLASANYHLHLQNTVVGIKGLPGRKGLGIGHRPNSRSWTSDIGMEKLKSWIGEDYHEYVKFYDPV